MITGCNYWASHAGLRMWSRWDAAVVADDFAKLAGLGLTRLRVFPLWSEFQPIEILYGGPAPREIAFGDRPLPDTPAGRAGLDETMLDRFGTLLDLARDAGLAVEAGLVTGWMSGRLFAPPAFAGRNVLADPLVLRWQTRFVRHMVRRFRDHPAVACWSPGNECNALAPVDRHAAWAWATAIASAIRLEDPTRPISGGMHSLAPAADAGFADVAWTLSDQGEIFDRVNTHPYPLFTPHAPGARIDAFRNAHHAAAETRFFADLAGRPGAAEELGTLAPAFAGEAVKAAYLRNAAFNLMAADAEMLAWWCAFDQPFDYPPYTWNSVERELGLFRADGTPKPVAETFRRLNDLLARLPAFGPAPADAVCVLSQGQDAWSNAWGAWLLAKQVGANIRFAFGMDPLPDAACYLLPGVKHDSALDQRRYDDLLARAHAGATVYVSIDDGRLSPLDAPFGVESLYYERRFSMAAVDVGGRRFAAMRPARYAARPVAARVAGTADGGEPVFFDHAYGKGRTLLLTLPLERHATEHGDDVNRPDAWDGRAVYAHFLADAAARHPARSTDPLVTLTCHPVDDPAARLVLAVNNRPEPAAFAPALAPGWTVATTWHGSPERLDANDAWVATIRQSP